MQKKAFTLIELLVVVTIIAILVGLLLPAVAKARSRAQRVATLTEVKQLETALRKYYQEYLTWPTNCPEVPPNPEQQRTEVGEKLALILGGRDPANNPRGLTFMEFTRVTNGIPYTAFEGRYYVKFDVNNDNQIAEGTDPLNDPPVPAALRPVIVWTYDNESNMIKSW